MAELEGRMSDVEHRLDLVRDQVDTLQSDAAEKKKPWLRQTPSLASVLALLVSILTAVYSAIRGVEQDVEQKHSALRGLVSQLIDLSAEYQNKLGSADSQKIPQQEREIMSGIIESKRKIMSEAADNLVRQIPKTVTSAEYNFLANDKLVNGGAAKAEEYLKKAVKVSGDAVAKMNALRSLAGFYAQPGPLQDMEKTRNNFQQAVEALGGEPRDDATRYLLGLAWEWWGTAEYMNNFSKEGAQKFERARKYYSDLSMNYPSRQSTLTNFERRERGFATSNQAPLAAPPNGVAPVSSPPMQAAPSARPRH